MPTRDILYLSAYLSSRYDNHKKICIKNDDFDYIQKYYESIINNNLGAVIFIDNTTDVFIKKYQNKNIFFIKQENIINKIHHADIIQPHDLRFILFYYFIQKNIQKYKYFVMTDISDVIIINDVGELLNQQNNNLLFIGKENEKILENKWFFVYLNRIKKMFDFSFDKNIFAEKTILNCGIIAGNSNLILQLLELIATQMEKMYDVCISRENKPLDMFLINHIIYSNPELNIYNGDELHTKFGHYLYENTKYIMHK